MSQSLQTERPLIPHLLLDLSLLQTQIIAVTFPTLYSRNRVTCSTETADLEEEAPLLGNLQLHSVGDWHP